LAGGATLATKSQNMSIRYNYHETERKFQQAIPGLKHADTRTRHCNEYTL